MSVRRPYLEGNRYELSVDDDLYPQRLREIPHPPQHLYVVGEPEVLSHAGLAIVGARRATPYGRSAAKHFATGAAQRGIVVVSGGARGCDSVAHTAALSEGGETIAFLGGGCNQIYPAENAGLFQRIIDAGGAVVSEREWDFPPQPYAFRERNRLIAGLTRATLIVEAGLPSGTFSTADEALNAGREVWVVPGAITSETSRGANRLLYQGALPIIDDDSFVDALSSLFGCMGVSRKNADTQLAQKDGQATEPTCEEMLLQAIRAEPLGMEALRGLVQKYCPASDSLTWLMVWLAAAQRDGLIAQYPDGRYGPRLDCRERESL